MITENTENNVVAEDDDFGMFETAPAVTEVVVETVPETPNGEVSVEVVSTEANTEVPGDTAKDGEDEDEGEDEEDDGEKLLVVKRLTPRKKRGSTDENDKVGINGVEITIRVPCEDGQVEKFVKGLALDRRTAITAKTNAVIANIPDWKEKSKEFKDALLEGINVTPTYSLFLLVKPYADSVSTAVANYVSDQQARIFPTRGSGGGDSVKVKELKDSAITMLQSSLSTIIVFVGGSAMKKQAFLQICRMPVTLRAVLIPTLNAMREEDGLAELEEVGSGLVTKDQLIEKLDSMLSLAKQYMELVEKDPETATTQIMAIIAAE